MRRLQPPLLRTAALLTIMCGAVSTTAIPLNDIFARQATCPASFSTCPGLSLPDNFCCPNGQTCIPLAGGTTLLCCPTGFACDKIETIPCDLSLQDASKQPRASLKTTALTGVLPKCGDKCCPFGYSCSKPGECTKDADQSKSPLEGGGGSSTTTTSASSTRPTSTAPAVTSVTTSPSSAVPSIAEPTPTFDATTGASESADIEASENNGPSVAVIAGVTIGAIAAILLAALIAWFLVKRKSKPQKSPSLKLSRSSSSFGNIISNPIIVEGTAMRSDFNRGPAKRSFEELAPIPRNVSPMTVSPPSSSGSGASRPRDLTGNGLRQSSVAYGGPPPYTTPPNPSRNQESSLFPPQTPRQDRGAQDREPSSVSINVFADPMALTPESASNAARRGDARRNSNMTTFTQLMDEADLGGVARGQPFIPYRPSTPLGGSPARK